MKDKLTKTEIAERLLAGEIMTVTWSYCDDDCTKRYDITLGNSWDRPKANSAKAALRMLGVNTKHFGRFSGVHIIDAKNRTAKERGLNYFNETDISHLYFPGEAE